MHILKIGPRLLLPIACSRPLDSWERMIGCTKRIFIASSDGGKQGRIEWDGETQPSLQVSTRLPKVKKSHWCLGPSSIAQRVLANFPDEVDGLRSIQLRSLDDWEPGCSEPSSCRFLHLQFFLCVALRYQDAWNRQDTGLGELASDFSGKWHP